MTATVRLNTRRAQEAKLNFLLAAVQGDGDLTSLLAWADWLEEQGSQRRAAVIRRDALMYASWPGRTITGETWLRWHAAYRLKVMAKALIKAGTAYGRFLYVGYYNKDGSMAEADGSLEYGLANGHVPTLRRGSKRQARLGRIIEGLGYQVFWV